MTERKIKNEVDDQLEIEKQKKLEEKRKKLAEKRRLEEANLTEEEKQQRLKERRKAAMQKKLEGLSEEEKQKLLEERRKRARQKKLEEQVKIQKQNIGGQDKKDAKVSHKIQHEINKSLESGIESENLKSKTSIANESLLKKSKTTNKKLKKQLEAIDIEQDVISNNSKEGEASMDDMEANDNMRNNRKRHSKEGCVKSKNSHKELKKENKKNNKQRKKQKKKLSTTAKVIITIILLLLIALGVFVGKRIKENGGGVQGIVATMLGHDASTLEKLPELRFAIIGQSQNLTDTIMVCSYNPRSQKASILSVPRDTYIGSNKNKATAFDKINALYQQSPEKLIKKINELTELDVKYYVHVDTKGLVDLVDAVGGVEFDVPVNMNYDDPTQNLAIHLKSGYQLLDGKKAEQLLRFRHNNNGSTYPAEYGQEDIGRMKTQREFLKAVIKKMAKAENITKVDDFVVIANKYVTTNMDFNSFKDYAPYALSFSSDNVRTETLPGASEKCNGLWFYIYNKKQTQALVKDMFALEPQNNATDTSDGTNSSSNVQQSTNSNVSVKGVRVEILNGTSNSKNLTNLKSALQKAGFTVSKTGTTSATSKTTIVSRTGKSEDIANKLRSTVGAGTISTGSNNSNVDFTIVIGSDF